MLLARFKNRMRKLIGNNYKNCSYVVGCSGGIDSVVLTHLMHRSRLRFILAHVNYNLRGQDSLLDAQHVQALAQQLNVPCYVHSMELKKELQKGDNLQNKARQERYAFFRSLVQTHDADFIMTAHHALDNLETALIQLVRGAHVVGIPEMHEQVVRPLLHFDKTTICNYARRYRLSWREDVSNMSDDYLRNRIRHHVIPHLVSIYDKVELTAAESLDRSRLMKEVYDRTIQDFIANFVKQKKDTGWVIGKKELFNFSGRFGVIQALVGQYLSTKEIYRLFDSDKTRRIELNQVSIYFSKHHIEINLKNQS